MARIKTITERTICELLKRGLVLKVFKEREGACLFGERFILPPHNERDWFRGYVRYCLEEKSMKPEDITKITRESYALLRYKQALAGSSDGSQLGAMLAVGGHVPDTRAKKAYSDALRDFDSRQQS